VLTACRIKSVIQRRQYID